MTVILNTWIFEDDVKKGTSQVDLVERVKKLGADGIEVRREYFTDLDKELAEVGTKAKEAGMVVNYSVPDVVFEESGEINTKLSQYFAEGKTMGISKIKFNTGYFKNFKGDLKEEFSKFPLEEIEMNVENDQTPVSGTVKAINEFLSAIHAVGFTGIGYVYDLGNWAFTHGDAIASADALANYTNYIHLKNTIDNQGELSTSDDLDTGVYDWRDILTHLPKDVQFALEYPMSSDELIQQQIQLLKKEIGG
ncbi:TIM barrel protein [Tetragenococcus halophilus]|uniref:sugar phosphate isomerase/epimerase family protein n=1 Tax=Tetragenococcus halophilus TaxID=51669 RepID=UPI00256B2815|nr:TIM barrel protein [Tetragenococcus halophilus]MDN6161454.1 sugar phosphate isomerase/epimerase [Atopostipes sp.]GMG62058.1 TIM barrel protein [Tetragenococcus halophilus]